LHVLAPDWQYELIWVAPDSQMRGRYSMVSPEAVLENPSRFNTLFDISTADIVAGEPDTMSVPRWMDLIGDALDQLPIIFSFYSSTLRLPKSSVIVYPTDAVPITLKYVLGTLVRIYPSAAVS